MKSRRNLFHSGAETILDGVAAETILRIHRDREKASGQVRSMLTYMAKNLFDADFTVRNMKQACKIRDNNLALFFHQEVGMPPKMYLYDCRLEVAARLLRRSELPIWQVGEMVGFTWPGAFGRTFRQWSGRSPGDYRTLWCQGTAPKVEPSSDEASCLLVWRRVLNGRLEAKRAEELIRELESIYMPPRGRRLYSGYRRSSSSRRSSNNRLAARERQKLTLQALLPPVAMGAVWIWSWNAQLQLARRRRLPGADLLAAARLQIPAAKPTW